MNNNIKIALYLFAGIISLIVYSYLSSLVFNFLTKIPLEYASPLSIWEDLSKPHTFENLQSKLFVSFSIPALLGLGAAALILGAPETNQFGDSKWATGNDIRKANLFKKDGLILGKFKGKYLISDTPTHAMLVAPTRSGKGVGIIIPTLLAWKGSLICLDVKNENYKKTAGFRAAHGQKTFMWSPLDKEGRSHRYNPLDAVSSNPYQKISDLQIIAKILIPDPPKSDPIWASEARALFIGLALYVIDNDEMASTIGAINRLLGTEQDLAEICRHIVTSHAELSSTIKKSLMNFANKAAKERSGVKSSVNQAINLWDNPVIDAATSASDFTIEDLRKEKSSIYVGVLTGQISTLSPLLRIFFEQVITGLSMEEPDESEPHQVLLMLDEFHMLGKMDVMTNAFTLLAGYACRVVAVVQGLKFLDDTYGRDKRDGILSCCAHQIFFAANDLETARYVSESCGEKTIQTTSSSKRHSMAYEAPTKNTSFRGRPLITKEKVKQLPQNEQIILVEAARPIRCNKIEYFKDKNLKQREIPPPEVPFLKIKDQIIPHFDIPDPSLIKADKDRTDPNQTNLDLTKTTDKNPNMSDQLLDSPKENETNTA